MSLAEPVTSISLTRDAESVLTSTLDSTIRLMDKSNGKLLQSYKAPEVMLSSLKSIVGYGLLITNSCSTPTPPIAFVRLSASETLWRLRAARMEASSPGTWYQARFCIAFGMGSPKAHPRRTSLAPWHSAQVEKSLPAREAMAMLWFGVFR